MDEAAFTLWLMVADIKELPTLDEQVGWPSWQRQAACRGEGTEIFIVGRGGRSYTRAKELCGMCPVASECLEYALADEDLVGYWANTTGAERQVMRLSRGVA